MRAAKKARVHTRTSTFGVGRREGHDASLYYARSLMTVTEDKVTEPTRLDRAARDSLFCHSSEQMHELPDNSVALMVTSPPYHVGKEYDGDQSFDDYLAMIERVLAETYRVLEPGGRAVVNVAGLGRRPYVPLPDIVAGIMSDIGYFPRGEIIWVKAKGASGSIAVGTFCSAKNPVLRDLHEYLLVFSKGRYDRAYKGVSTISKDAFFEAVNSVWYIRPESARKVGHPAPFPVELPRRCIELFTYAGDVVLDPFMGAGATAVAAAGSDRSYVGYDTDQAYLDIAATRIVQARQEWLETMPRPSCCLCPDGCAGVDPPDGQPGCLLECAWCVHGCPAGDGPDCCRYQP